MCTCSSDVGPMATHSMENRLHISSQKFGVDYTGKNNAEHLLALLLKNTRLQRTGEVAYMLESPLTGTTITEQLIYPYLDMLRPD